MPWPVVAWVVVYLNMVFLNVSINMRHEVHEMLKKRVPLSRLWFFLYNNLYHVFLCCGSYFFGFMQILSCMLRFDMWDYFANWRWAQQKLKEYDNFYTASKWCHIFSTFCNYWLKYRANCWAPKCLPYNMYL